jgi:hypothetical protein
LAEAQRISIPPMPSTTKITPGFSGGGVTGGGDANAR